MGAVTLLVFASVVRAGTGDAREWITRMNAALATRSYDGVFIHAMSGKRQTLRVIHRMENGKMTERLIFANGSGWEVVRNGSEWVAYFPDLKIARVETRNRSWGAMVTLNGLTDETKRNYEISTAGTERLLGRTAQLVRVDPRDGFRYGYRFWLDQQTAMPLKTQRITRAGEVLEEISFLTLEMRTSIPDELLKPDVDPDTLKWLRPDIHVDKSSLKTGVAPRKELLPPGFRVAFNNPEADSKAPRTRFIVSDGVNWVSVFIEPADKAQPAPGAPPDGVVLMGLSATYVVRQDGYKVTAVGEVPPLTVKSIADAFQPE
ncbi:MAG: MucB/RseB C-terminal domain-containing protein [Steroidobacteraceae bacterium]